MRDPHRPRSLAALVALVALVAVATAACATGGRPTWTFSPLTATAGSPAPASPGAPGQSEGTIAIEAFDLGFKPAQTEVASAGTYTVKFVNTGALVHDITFADGTKLTAQAGQTVEGEVTIPDAGMTFICSIPGHEQAGMKGEVLVAGYGSGSGTDDGDHGGPGAVLPSPDPNAPAPVTFDPAAPERLEGETHEIVLTIEEKLMTVAPGYQIAVWTFDGAVPGPTIRVKVGDSIRVRLVNPATSQLPHSVDFHSSQVAWNDEMTSIDPGEEKIYEWRADYAGVWMYHCGTAPALHHIANGMFGMVIVEPKEGLPAVDHEFALVQSEWYFGEQAQVTDLTKAAAGAPSPDWVVFNGVAAQYVDAPIKVDTGKRVRVFVLDAGPSIDSSFHVVGTIFDTVIKEGVVLARGNEGNWGSQAVDLAPAQGAIVEFTTAEDGLYPIVTHAFNFPGRGALGLFQAGDGDPKN
jgi:nitrite reductase (NO-forming)